MEVSVMAAKKKEVNVTDEDVNAIDIVDELRQPMWSVISFEKCVYSNLTYDDADRKLRELDAERVSGLCIVTNETAARIGKRGTD
jgi:hypothetical protein